MELQLKKHTLHLDLRRMIKISRKNHKIYFNLNKKIKVKHNSQKSIEKHVHFSNKVCIYEYPAYIPFGQEIETLYEQCKLNHLQHKYLQKHGTLDGFNFEIELKKSDEEDLQFEIEALKIHSEELYENDAYIIQEIKIPAINIIFK